MKKTSIIRLMTILTSFVLLMGILPQFSVSAAYENTHINTGNQREDIVAVAETQIGYQEGANNDTKYNRWNGTISGYPENGYGYPWCHCFVSWCANQAGISTDIIPRTAGTSTGRSFFVKQGTYKQSAANGGSYIPQRGDIIYYGSGSSPSHVGIVSNCDGSTVYTIEGNYSDKVGTRAISLSNSYIIGYGVPNYGGSVPPVDTEPPTYSNISISKTKYVIGENIVFIFSSDNATGHIMGLYRNGERYHTSPDMSDNSYVYTLTEAGDYYAYVTSYNSLGYKDSQAVYFSVYDSAPNESVISIDRDKYILGEDIQFSFSSDSATGYIMGIYRNGDRCHTSPDMSDNSYVYTPNEAGDYYAYVTSYNSLGYKDSQAVYFSVYDSAPNESNISIEKNKYKIGEKITFLFSSDVATGYILGIDKNGERYYTSPNLTENNYTYPIAETGDYYAYVTSYNPLGYKDSIGVWFTVYDPNVKTADLNQDGSVTIIDALLLQKHLLNFKKLTTEQMELADINSDGRVNILDMSLLKEKLK